MGEGITLLKVWSHAHRFVAGCMRLQAVRYGGGHAHAHLQPIPGITAYRRGFLSVVLECSPTWATVPGWLRVWAWFLLYPHCLEVARRGCLPLCERDKQKAGCRLTVRLGFRFACKFSLD